MTELEQALSTVLARLAHDVKNPLSVVASNLQFLRETASDRSLLEAVEDSAFSLERALRMIDDAVDLGRLRTGALPIARARFKLAEMEAPLRAAIAPLLARRTLRIELGALELASDRALLSRALVSLLEHAVKHTASGRAVLLRAAPGPDPGLELLDGGLPFSPEREPSFLSEEIAAHEPAPGRWRSDQGIALVFAGAILRRLGAALAVTARDDGQPGARFRARFPSEPA